MSRKTIPPATLRALFARSGNRCAFPECQQVLVSEKNLFVGQVAHIEGVEAASRRHNPDQSDDGRACYDNLILLCYAHHVEIDHPSQCFTAADLRLMKLDHEKRSTATFRVNAEVLRQAQLEAEVFWERVAAITANEHPMPDLSIRFSGRANTFTLVARATRVRKRLQEMCTAVCDLLGHQDDLWEVRNIGIPNFFKELTALSLQLEMRILEDYLVTNPQDDRRRAQLARARRVVGRMARSSGYVD